MLVEVGADVADVGVTMQEQADETFDASPSQPDAKVGRLAFTEAVKVGQNADAAEAAPMNCLRQLSWLQLGTTTEAVAVTMVVAVGVAEASFL